jgi:energy-coupling factor transporter ATP-binding protein EcfA2
VRRAIGAAALPLLGLSREKRRIEDAVRRGESLLILGPAGSGKTALVKSIAASVPGAVYVEYRRVLHDMLASLATALIESRHPRFTALVRNGNSPAKWANEQTSVHLRGVLWSGLETGPCLVILDSIERSSFQAYRFFQRVYYGRGMRMIAVARDPVGLGELRRLFWDPRQMVQMMPLAETEASVLFELAADQFGLREFDLDDFRPRVLDNAKGNPGQIVEMCRMAREPQYRSGKHILFAPLRIDLMARYLA